MKKLAFIIYTLLITHYSSFAQDLKYYLPDSVTYNPSIPKPKDIIYHEVGEWHITPDRLVNQSTIQVFRPEFSNFTLWKTVRN